MKEYDIRDEEWREYDYGGGTFYRINNPKTLYIREGGSGERILDNDGVVH